MPENVLVGSFDAKLQKLDYIIPMINVASAVILFKESGNKNANSERISHTIT